MRLEKLVRRLARCIRDIRPRNHARDFLAPLSQRQGFHRRQASVPVLALADAAMVVTLGSHLRGMGDDKDLQGLGQSGKPAADGGVEWQVAGYNAPFVLPRFKTNEVLVSVLERAAS